jgi:enoyl-CoA hydratase
MGRYGGYKFLEIDHFAPRAVCVRLNRPERLNAIPETGFDELLSIWHDIDDDPDVNVAVVTGAGDAFCVGGDQFRDQDDDPEYRHYQQERNAATVWSLVNMRKPLISAINGPAVGAGLRLALLADISVASDRAKLIDGHRRLGVTAGDHAAIVWPLLCGMAKAKYYLMRQEPLSGAEASELGLVSLCVPHEKLWATASEIACDLAAGPQWSLRGTKRVLNHWMRMAGPIFEHSAALEAMNFLHPDGKEGPQAFREKRAPSYPSAGLGPSAASTE